MAISAKTRLGRYEIRSAIGAGGMGEVYRARDTQLGRDVASRFFLGTTLSIRRDCTGSSRKHCAAGALNHPNILIVL